MKGINMGRNLVKSFSFILLFIAGCESSVLLKVEQKENKLYHTSVRMISDDSVNYRADEQTMDRLKATGITLPMIIRKEQIIKMTSRTGMRGSHGELPFSAKVDSVFTTQFLNGKLQNQTQSMPLDTSFRFSGFFDRDSAVIGDMRGQNLDASMMETIKSVFTQVMKTFKFPDKPLKVGDSFTRSTPLLIPIGKFGSLKMAITTKYTVRKIDSKNVDFDMNQTDTLDSRSDSTKFSASGEGTGRMIYDRSESYIVLTDTKSTIAMKVDVGPIEIFTDGSTDMEIRTVVGDR